MAISRSFSSVTMRMRFNMMPCSFVLCHCCVVFHSLDAPFIHPSSYWWSYELSLVLLLRHRDPCQCFALGGHMPHLGQSHTQEFRIPEYVSSNSDERRGWLWGWASLHKNTHRNGTILTVGELEACSLIAHRDVGSIGQEDPLPVSMSEHRSLSLLPGVSGRGWSLGCRRKPALQGHMLHVPAHCPGDRGPGLGHVRDKEPAPFLSLCVCVCGWVGGMMAITGKTSWKTWFYSGPQSLRMRLLSWVGGRRKMQPGKVTSKD